MRNILNTNKIIPILVVFLFLSIGVLSSPLNKSIAAGTLPSEYEKGDIDNNELVNMSDFGEWLVLFRGFKATGAYDVKGDLDLDQKIGMGDFGEWLIVWRAYKAYMEGDGTISTFEFSEISVGDYHTCGLGSDGNGYCWGYNNHGQLGTGTSDSNAHSVPELVLQGDRDPGVTFTSISTGLFYTCGLGSDGNGYCWGHNESGQLGTGDTDYCYTPKLVSQGDRGVGVTFTSISAGTHHTCGIGSDSDGYCWGANEFGGLGTGDTTQYTSPKKVSTGVTFTSISTGAHHTCGIGSDGNGYCWGINYIGQLGTGTSDEGAHSTPELVLQGDRGAGITFTSISVGYQHTCGVGSDGSGYCWGYNYNGQLGTGDDDYDYDTPKKVSTGVIFTSISVRYSHTCGLGSDGNGYCWGANEFGGLGTGDTTQYTSPKLVLRGDRDVGVKFVSISVGDYYTCGVGSNGNAYCWGDNDYGQLGTGDTTDSYTPKLVKWQDSTTPVEIVSMLIHIVRTITNINE